MSESATAELPYWLALHRAINLTARRYETLRASGHPPQEIWADPSGALLQKLDRADKVIERFLAKRPKISPPQEWDTLQRLKIEVLLFDDPNYPAALSTIYAPPPLLFFRGKMLPQDWPAVGVVGARNMSSYGRQVLQKIVPPLAEARITIVSGLALGVDGQSHRLTLDHQGRTIAVLGHGLDQIVPRTHEPLANEILEKEAGALVSEYLPQTEVRPENFPQRNRLIAGLSKAVIIAEASHKSGSLITAQLALEQGRDVWAVPANIFTTQNQGTNQLLEKGQAGALLSATPIIESLGIKTSLFSPEKTAPLPALSTTERAIIDTLKQHEKLHLDDLIRQVEAPVATIQASLMILEARQLVIHLEHHVYSAHC